MKKVIPLPELGFIKHKTCQTKAAVIKTVANTRHRRLRKEKDKRNEREEMR